MHHPARSPFYHFLNRRPGEEPGEADKDFIDWNGFLLPMSHGDAEAEYFAIRHEAALFDVSPMRKIRITGTDAGRFLDSALTKKVSGMPGNQASYVIFCNEDGTVKDDAMLYKFSQTDYLLLPSDIDHSDYFRQLAESRDMNNVAFNECTDSLAGIALQGPCAAAVALEMGLVDASSLAPYEFQSMASAAGDLLVARMGFTADLGFEFWLPPGQCNALIQLIETARANLGMDLPGYGLSALEACRIEGGFVVAGWDFSTELDPQPGFERYPNELGLTWLVDLDHTDFVGREALVDLQGRSRFLIRRFSTTATGSLDGQPIFGQVGDSAEAIGIINCATWSWGLGSTIGNASIKRSHKGVEAGWLEVDGNRHEVRITRGPFVNFERKNEVPAPINLTRVD